MPHLIGKASLQTVRSNWPLIILLSGQVVTALAGLAYGKLTAVYISPAVWGDYNLLLTGMTLLHGLFISPTLQSFKSALSQFSQRQTSTFYGKLLLRTYLGLALPTLLAGLYYENTNFGLIWIAAVGQGFYLFGSNYLNAAGLHRSYALMQAGYASGTVFVFAVMVIIDQQRTVSGLWQTTAFINGLFAIPGVYAVVRKHGNSRSAPLAESSELGRTYREYVWPLLSLAFWSWLINYADRYLIRFYLTDADVGQYAMGYSLGSKPLLLVAPLLAFLSPRILNLRAIRQPSASANPLLLRYLTQYVLLAGAGCFLFYLGREQIGELLLSNRYRAAFLIGPIVAIGYIFLTSIHLLEVKWYAFGQTRLVLWHNVVGAVLNVTFTSLLIPRFGILGAALATLLGFAGQFLLAIWLFLSVRYNGYETSPPDPLTLHSL